MCLRNAEDEPRNRELPELNWAVGEEWGKRRAKSTAFFVSNSAKDFQGRLADKAALQSLRMILRLP